MLDENCKIRSGFYGLAKQRNWSRMIVPKHVENSGLTYKKAIKVICDHLNDHGFSVTKSAQKQVGYLTLYATEGEISKQLHHDIKARLKNLPCKFEPGSMSDEHFEVFMERYACLLGRENPEGGEISLGWLFKELQDQEIWQVFSGHEI